MSTSSFRLSFRRPLAPWLAVVALALPALGRAADSNGGDDKNLPSFSDKTSEVFTKLAPMLTAKNWDGALALLTAALPTVEADSYDQAVIENTLGGIYVQGKEQPEKAIQPWEHMLDIVSRHPNYFTPAEVTTHYQYLANIYTQMAMDVKLKDPVLKKSYLDKSLVYMKHYLKDAVKPRSEDLYIYAILLYQRASIDAEHLDRNYLDQAIDAAQVGLHADLHPKESFYQLLVGTYVQENELERAAGHTAKSDEDLETAAGYIELIVKNHPTGKEWWPQLFGIYNNLAANNEKNPDLYREYLARDINTLERAQALGFMKEKVDNMNLVTMYEQAGQYGIATDLLYKGLLNGSIDATKKENWTNLALFYKQIGDYFSAVKVFKEADQRFPNTGDFDLQISDIYNSDLNNTQEAYNYSKMAVAKGNLGSRAYYAYYYLAFEAYELLKYDEALAACEAGLKLPNASKELSNLRDAIKAAIDQANQAKEAMKVQQSKT